MSFFSPFHAVLDNNKYPHAHAHRSTFWEKLWATFKAFSGNILPGALKNPAKYTKIEFDRMHFGIFDYLTLGIHFLLSFLSMLLIENKFLPFKIAGIILFSALTIPRVVFAISLTILSFPFIIIAHWAASFKGDALKETIMSHQVSKEINNKEAVSKEKVVKNSQTFGILLQENNVDLTDIVDIELKPNGNKNLFTLSFFKYDSIANPTKMSLELDLCLHDKSHNKMFKALKKLNVGGLQTKIEANNELNFYN